MGYTSSKCDLCVNLLVLEVCMTDITLMTSCASPAMVLPSLTLLSHRVRVLPLDSSSFVRIPEQTVLLMDARDDLATAKSLCNLLHVSGVKAPIILILTEGGFTVVNATWGVADVVLTGASPAEVEGRLRLVAQRSRFMESAAIKEESSSEDIEISGDGCIYAGELVVDTRGYTVTLHGQPIDLAYKEFELLKYFVQHPRRVFTRAHLLQEVWGYDYYGGTRTVDVHIRRLRAKLGGEYEHVIGTVRNVGYRFDPPEDAVVDIDGSDEDLVVSSSRISDSVIGSANGSSIDSSDSDDLDDDTIDEAAIAELKEISSAHRRSTMVSRIAARAAREN